MNQYPPWTLAEDTRLIAMREEGYSTAQGFNTKCTQMGAGELPDENQVGSFSKTSISRHNTRQVAVSSTDTLKTPVGGESSGLLNIGANETILNESGNKHYLGTGVLNG